VNSIRKMAFALILIATIIATSAGLVGLAFAQGNETAPAGPGSFEPIYEVFKSVGYAAPVAIMVGLTTCLLGYMKQATPQNFKLEEFISTALISLIIGIATIYGGWAYTDIAQWLGNGGLTVWVYWAAKITAKKLWPSLTVTATDAGPPKT